MPTRLALLTEESARLHEKLNDLRICVDHLDHKIMDYTERVLPIERTLAGVKAQEATTA